MRLALSMVCCFSLLSCDAGEATRRDEGGPSADGAEGDAGEEDGAAEQDGSVEADAGLCTRCGGCVESQTVGNAQHVSGGVDYPDPPPTGGAHDPCWTSFGVHTKEVPDERWVHNLEHGAVVFLYHCPAGCAAEVAALEALTGPRPFALVMPYAALPTRFAVVAWGRRLLSACLDEEAFRAFYETYFDKAPESLVSPPPSDC